MTPAERDTPSEGAVREQLREEPGPRASSAPAEGREPQRSEPAFDAAGAGSSDGAAAEGGDAAAIEEGRAEVGGESEREGAPSDEAAVADSESAATADRAPEEEFAEADPLAEAERQRDEYLALAQRTQADFENFRRRAARDAAAAGARAKAGLVRELLPVLDNLERALEAAGDGADEGVAQGVKMVHSELVAALERNGVAAFVPTGEPFDPTVHEAIATRPADGAEPGVVLEVVEKGYHLEDTVLRPARVVVSA